MDESTVTMAATKESRASTKESRASTKDSRVASKESRGEWRGWTDASRVGLMGSTDASRASKVVVPPMADLRVGRYSARKAD
jgi:hypothetical protein